jgi:hypothetical protein
VFNFPEGDFVSQYNIHEVQWEGGEAKQTKKALIEQCRAKKIPYSGKTKAELLADIINNKKGMVPTKIKTNRVK